jgi:hypothetical protein
MAYSTSLLRDFEEALPAPDGAGGANFSDRRDFSGFNESSIPALSDTTADIPGGAPS